MKRRVSSEALTVTSCDETGRAVLSLHTFLSTIYAMAELLVQAFNEDLLQDVCMVHFPAS